MLNKQSIEEHSEETIPAEVGLPSNGSSEKRTTKRIPTSKIFFQILKNSFLRIAVLGYLLFFFLSALVTLIAESSITNYGDALWYCFVACTTIGFGDFAAAGFVGRIVTVVLYIYTVLILALITAVFTQFFIEIAKARNSESVSTFQHDLEHLAELPRERLDEISRKVKEFTKHI